MKNFLNYYFAAPFTVFKQTKHMTRCSMILALSVLSSYVMSFYPTNYLKISFSFIFIAIAASEYGPIIASVIAAASDIITFLAHPQGAYIAPLTITAAIGGIIVGLFLYKRKCNLWRIIVSRTIIVAFISTIIDTYILSSVMGKVFFLFLSQRVIKNAIALPIEIIIMYIILKRISKPNKIK